MLFVEGNHFCPGCEKSGNCQLQALGYEFEMLDAAFRRSSIPHREVDASHPDVLHRLQPLHQCELCVRASRDVDDKDVFALAGRGRRRASDRQFADRQARRHAISPSTDKAAHVCPVGAILHQARRLRRADRRARLRPRADQRRGRESMRETEA